MQAGFRRTLFQSFRNRRFSSTPGPTIPTGDRKWFFGAMAVALPTGYYLYHRHAENKRRILSEKPVVSPEIIAKYDGAVVLGSLNGDSIKETAIPSSADPRVVLSPLVLKAKYLLVGGGLASFAAMESILAADPSADILIITEEAYPPYMRPPLSKELWYNHEKGSGKDDEQFQFADWHGEKKPVFFQDAQFYDNPYEKGTRSVRLLTGRKAVSLDVDQRIVKLHDGTTIEFEKALLGTGSTSKKLTNQMDPNISRNVSHLRQLSDFKQIRKAVDESGHIAIIGGGFIGSELAACISSYSQIERPEKPVKITQIFPEDGNMGLVFPRYLSVWAMKQLRSMGVDIWPDSVLKMISRLDDDRVRVEVATAEGEKSVDVDHVIVAIGAKPNTEIAAGTPIVLDQSQFGGDGLRASPELELVPGVIWGAGDVISYHDPSLDVWRRVEHYDHALHSGRLAGFNMASPPAERKPYETVSMFWSDLGPAVGYEAVGLTDSSLTTVGVWAKAREKDTPAQTELDPSDIRTESIGQTAPSSVDPLYDATITHQSPDEEYRKGLVLYIREKQIVGLLMFNLFNRTALAKNIIKQRMTVDNLQDVVELFNINDV